MKLFRAQFSFVTENNGRMPGFTGNLVRGFLGEYLWQHDKELYDILFEKKLLHKQFPGHAGYPSPFVLYAHYKPGGQYRTGDEFSFRLGFWNDYKDYYPRVVELLMQNPRVELENGLKLRFQGSRNLASPFTHQPGIDWNNCQQLSTTRKVLQIKWQSPAVFHSTTEPSFADFLRSLQARFNYLQTFFGSGEALPLPDPTTIQTLECHLKFVRIPHRHRSGQVYAINGWTGFWKIFHPGAFKPWYPLLVFGQYMQTGHRTSAGFGKYRLKLK